MPIVLQSFCRKQIALNTVRKKKIEHSPNTAILNKTEKSTRTFQSIKKTKKLIFNKVTVVTKKTIGNVMHACSNQKAPLLKKKYVKACLLHKM